MRIQALVAAFIVTTCSFQLAAQQLQEDGTTASFTLEDREEFNSYRNGFFLLFQEGAAASWVTRIIKQENRSNFVFDDFLAGLFFTTRTKNLSNFIGLPIEAMARIAAYYPLSHTFNGQPQKAVNILNYGLDLFIAPSFQINFWNYARLNLAVGPHFFYQLGDRWHYAHLGGGAMACLEMPLARRWTLLLDGMASIDYGNLGSNSRMEPYDIVWQYQLSLGFRYSRRLPNRYSYIPSNRTDEDDLADMVAKRRD